MSHFLVSEGFTRIRRGTALLNVFSGAPPLLPNIIRAKAASSDKLTGMTTFLCSCVEGKDMPKVKSKSVAKVLSKR